MLIDPCPLVLLNERDMDTVDDAEMFGSGIFKWIYERFVLQPEVKSVHRWLPQARRLLDIGCGTGWTTAIWKRNGFEVIGLEPSRVRSQIAREKYGLNVFSGHIEELKDQPLFDVAVMRHILEHIEHPVDVLKSIHRQLREGGLLLITVPNIRSIGRYCFRESWQWVLPWHLHFYHPQTLRLLLQSNGFKVLKYYQMPSPLWYPDSFRAWFRDHGLPALGHPAFSILWIIPSLVLVLTGFILGKNDNMTFVVQKGRDDGQ